MSNRPVPSRSAKDEIEQVNQIAQGDADNKLTPSTVGWWKRRETWRPITAKTRIPVNFRESPVPPGRNAPSAAQAMPTGNSHSDIAQADVVSFAPSRGARYREIELPSTTYIAIASASLAGITEESRHPRVPLRASMTLDVVNHLAIGHRGVPDRRTPLRRRLYSESW